MARTQQVDTWKRVAEEWRQRAEKAEQELADLRRAVAAAQPERLASRAEVAEYLGVPAGTLTQWAHRGTGPRYIRVGKHTRYDWADVRAWLDARKRSQSGPDDG